MMTGLRPIPLLAAAAVPVAAAGCDLQLAQRLQDKQAELDAARAEIEEREQTIASVKGQLASRDAKIADLNQTIADMEGGERVDKAKERIAALEEKAAAAAGRAEDYESSLLAAQQRNDELSGKLDAAAKTVEELSATIGERDARISELEAKIEGSDGQTLRLQPFRRMYDPEKPPVLPADQITGVEPALWWGADQESDQRVDELFVSATRIRVGPTIYYDRRPPREVLAALGWDVRDGRVDGPIPRQWWQSGRERIAMLTEQRDRYAARVGALRDHGLALLDAINEHETPAAVAQAAQPLSETLHDGQ